MLTPRQIEDFPQRLIELYAEVEADIIQNMAERIGKLNYFIPAAQWQYEKLIEMGFVHDDIIKKLSKALKKSKSEIERLMKVSGVQAIKKDVNIYRKQGLSPPTIDASAQLLNVLQTGISSTNGLFENLTRTTANMATNQFERALDRAWLQIATGAFDHNSAIRTAVKDLTDNGLEAVRYPPTRRYPNGRTDHVDVAVRRAMVTGLNHTAILMSEQLAIEMGCDLMDITAHAGARTGKGAANHAAWQGKRVSRSGRAGYLSLKDIGYNTGPGFGGWNCRHNWFPAFEGTSPVYTQEELDELNAEKYTYNGRKLTEYEATQTQRGIERNIRKYKREYIGMRAAGQPTDDAVAKLAKWQKAQKDFITQTGLKRQYDRETVQGFRRSKVGVASENDTRNKNIILPNDMVNDSKIPADIQGEIKRSIDQVHSEYSVRVDEIVYRDISEQGKIPLQFNPVNDDGKFKSQLIINSGYDWNRTLDELNDRIYNKNYLSGKITSRNLQDLIYHEMAHFITFQDCRTWADFLRKEREIRQQFIPGLSAYNNGLEDGAETIAEGLVAIRNNEDVSRDIRDLIERYLGRWRNE